MLAALQTLVTLQMRFGNQQLRHETRSAKHSHFMTCYDMLLVQQQLRFDRAGVGIHPTAESLEASMACIAFERSAAYGGSTGCCQGRSTAD